MKPFSMSKSGYIHCNFERVDEHDLTSFFEGVSEEDDY